MQKCLFPISLGNNLFSTERVLSGLKTIPGTYDEIVFIIADQIQLYNRAFSVRDGSDLNDVIRRFYSGRTLFEQRSSWLDKLKVELGDSDSFPIWTVYGMDDVADQMFTKIYRNIIIMYNTVAEFQKDVNNEAYDHLSRRSSIDSTTEESVKLSVSYILEEIAASVRLHVCDKIVHEYYLGKNLNCVVRLYASHYGISVFSLADIEPEPVEWKFFDFSPCSNPPLWVGRNSQEK